MSTDLAKQPHLVVPTDVTRAHFGSTVTITIQLQGADPDDAAAFVNTVPGPGQELKYTVTVERFPGDRQHRHSCAQPDRRPRGDHRL